ncbi:von Willebrand factor type A domain-containing protein [Xylogone sp. PMI_703]|nr:von Willebrand factor type A domain-containing protein [Xylogone sp. PMI_703]
MRLLLLSRRRYLPLVESEVHSTVLSITSKTTLRQKFTNPSATQTIKECYYLFPLFDGVSVVDFTCQIDSKVLHGVVKEKEEAKRTFDQAVASGKTAGYLEQTNEAGDVFKTKLGNIPPGKTIDVQITYIGELKHHDTDSIRFTIPTNIAPRYGSGPSDPLSYNKLPAHGTDGMKITVDINLPDGSAIKSIQSPSHPIGVSIGTLHAQSDSEPKLSQGSATLSQGGTVLEKDFVLIVESKNPGTPKALLETHDTIPNQRALMLTLVPKFSLPQSKPEIVFVADRSGSMQQNMKMLKSAMQVFLKSLPTGIMFNICSFGSQHSLLWPKSMPYNRENLSKALEHVSTFEANMGGTETYRAVQATIKSRQKHIPLELILLTDGDIWQQEPLFNYVNEQVKRSDGNIRVFPLGIGSGVSSSLIEGLARAGNGFAQSVQDGERLDKSVVRMVKGALSPHITNYTIEVKYKKRNEDEDDDFEMIDKVADGMEVLLTDEKEESSVAASEHQETSTEKKTISLFDPTVDAENDPIKNNKDEPLPTVPAPKLLQAPHKIPSLFPFSRTVVYLLMSPETSTEEPASVILRATSAHGPLELEIPVEVLPTPGKTIHQLAAKKAVQDLEEGRGWIFDAKDQTGVLIKDKYSYRFDDLVRNEAVRLGVRFQIAGKWTSFVAVAENPDKVTPSSDENDDNDEIYVGDSTELDELRRAAEGEKGEIRSYGLPPPAGSATLNLIPTAGTMFASFASATTAAAPRQMMMQAQAMPLPSSPPSSPGYGAPQDAAQNTFSLLSKKKKKIARTGSANFGAGAEEEEAPGPKTNADKVHELISLQDFEGYWDVKQEANLSSIMDIGVNNSLPASPSDISEDKKNIWVTLLVISFLKEKMVDEIDTWELVVEKGIDWVKSELGNEDAFERLEKEAIAVVNSKQPKYLAKAPVNETIITFHTSYLCFCKIGETSGLCSSSCTPLFGFFFWPRQ